MTLRIVRWFNRYGLSRRKLKKSIVYKIFGERIISKSLWRFEKGSVIRGWIIGCFGACNPFLGAQITLSAPFLLLFRGNVFVALVLIFMTNPFTIGPFLYAAYLLGAWLLGFHLDTIPEEDLAREMEQVPEKLSGIQWSELLQNPSEKVLAVLLGCVVIGIVCATVGAILIALLWREKPKAPRKNAVPFKSPESPEPFRELDRGHPEDAPKQ